MLSSLFNYNHNVLYTFLYKFSDGVAQGVWSAASMATYIYLLENNSTKVLWVNFTLAGNAVTHNDCAISLAESLLFELQYVGLAQGIQGTFVAISAIPGTLHRSLSGLQWVFAVACCHTTYKHARSQHTLPVAAGWLADRFQRDRVLKCCAVASCGECYKPLDVTALWHVTACQFGPQQWCVLYIHPFVSKQMDI